MTGAEGVLALFALVVVAVIAYRAGYLRGQTEVLHRGQPIEAEGNALRMESVLPRWRRVAGWAAYVLSGLLLCLFLFLAFQYARGWGWTGSRWSPAQTRPRLLRGSPALRGAAGPRAGADAPRHAPPS